MKIRGFILVVICIMFCSESLFAQKVINEGGKIFIDASGIPHSSIKKAQTTNATNSTVVPVDDETDIASMKSQEKVYKKFEVQKTDNIQTTWLDAINFCATLSVDGVSGWRLPTLREAVLMVCVLNSELKALGSSVFVPFDDKVSYWCATARSGSSSMSWVIYKYSLGFGYRTPASSTFRCIRDI